MTDLPTHRCTDAEMAQVRATFPGLRWRHSKDGGGVSTKAGKGGHRLWVVSTPPYRPHDTPSVGWQIDVSTHDHYELARYTSRTLAGVLEWARHDIAAERDRWAVLLPKEEP